MNHLSLHTLDSISFENVFVWPIYILKAFSSSISLCFKHVHMPHGKQKQNLTTYYFQGMFHFLFIYTNTLKERIKACEKLITQWQKKKKIHSKQKLSTTFYSQVFKKKISYLNKTYFCSNKKNVILQIVYFFS